MMLENENQRLKQMAKENVMAVAAVQRTPPGNARVSSEDRRRR